MPAPISAPRMPPVAPPAPAPARRRSDWTGDDETETRNDDRGANGKRRGQSRADAAAADCALTEAFSGLRALLEFSACLHVAEMRAVRFFRHHHVDVGRLIAMLGGQSFIGAAGGIRRRVETGHVTARRLGPAAGHVVGGLARASGGVLALAFGFHFFVADDVTKSILGRAFGALAEC